eukprot:scaffold2224_cov261-Pinguiococcus_pyrenoidosus.AAC.31
MPAWTSTAMKVTAEEMEAAQLPLEWRDHCAHILIPLNKWESRKHKLTTLRFRLYSGAVGRPPGCRGSAPTCVMRMKSASMRSTSCAVKQGACRRPTSEARRGHMRLRTSCEGRHEGLFLFRESLCVSSAAERIYIPRRTARKQQAAGARHQHRQRDNHSWSSAFICSSFLLLRSLGSRPPFA